MASDADDLVDSVAAINLESAAEDMPNTIHTQTVATSATKKGKDNNKRKQTKKSKKKAKKAKALLDLPTEIIENIFEAVLEDSLSALGVWCFDPLYDSHEPFQVNKHMTKMSWTVKWIPQLRLVSSTIRDIVSPVIAKHSVFYVRRSINPDKEEPFATWWSRLPIARLMPSFVRSHVKHIRIIDLQAEQCLLSVSPIDVSGCKNLEVLEFGPYDPAFGFHQAVELMHKQGGEMEMFEYLQDLVNNGKDFVDEDRLYPIAEMFGPKVTMISMIEQAFIPLFGSSDGYRALMEMLRARFWKIERECIRGLESGTKLRISFRDNEQAKATASIELANNEAPRYVVRYPAWKIHITSKHLDHFR